MCIVKKILWVYIFLNCLYTEIMMQIQVFVRCHGGSIFGLLKEVMLAPIKVVASKVRAFLLCIFAALRRACCCFKRRRRNSESQPLTAIGIVPNNQPTEEQGGWESWGREEDEVTRQIREYRTSLAAARQQKTPEPEEPQVNFFEDMTPKITRPPRIALKPENDAFESNTSHLLAAQAVPLGNELGAWVEEAGWEDEEEGDWQEQVREQRRQQKQKRAEEMQMKRAEHRSGLGARLS